jgi:hypothetical protein
LRLLLADHCHIGIGLFAGDVNVLAHSRHGSFSCARGHVNDCAFFVRAANDVEALFASESWEGAANNEGGRYKILVNARYLFLGLVVFDTPPKLLERGGVPG